MTEADALKAEFNLEEVPVTLVDKVGGLLGGATKESGQSPAVGAVLEMLSQGGSGGLAGLVQTFREKGDIVSSWISTGPRLPVSSSQIQSVLGNDTLRQLAEKAGLSLDAVSGQLAEILPGAVDKLTPDGKLPTGGVLEKVVGALKSRP